MVGQRVRRRPRGEREPAGHVSFFEQTIFTFDGTPSNAAEVNPEVTSSTAIWYQAAKWTGTLRVTETSPCSRPDPPGGPGFYRSTGTASGSGSTGSTVANPIIQLGDGGTRNSLSFAAATREFAEMPGQTVIESNCVDPSVSAGTFSACSAFYYDAQGQGLGATELHGSQTFTEQHGCASVAETTTVTWSLGRGIVDEDFDGWDDIGKDNCIPAQLPGDRQIGDPPMTVKASYNPDQSVNPCQQQPQCSDGIDNDGDAFTDYAADPGCTSAQDLDEAPNPQCSDDLDNDGDGSADFDGAPLDPLAGTRLDPDPGCTSLRDDLEASYRLTAAHDGDGRVLGSPGALDCPGACAREYVPATQVLLTVIPSQGWAFDHWTGNPCAGVPGPTCTVTMNEDKTVTAVFVRSPGTIIVDEATTPKSFDKQFKFSSSLAGLETFFLYDNTAPAHADVDPGRYTITQKATNDNWQLTDVTCTGGAPERSGTGVSVTVAGGQTITCTFTNHKGLGLSLAIAHGYTGNITGPNLRVVGTDTATVTGSTAALAQFDHACVVSTWQAKIHLNAPSSVPMFWNGQSHPFIDGLFDLIDHKPPDKKGLFKGDYWEKVAKTTCGQPGETLLNAPLALDVNGLGQMLSISHTATVVAYSAANQILGQVSTPSKSGSTPSFTLSAAKVKITI